MIVARNERGDTAHAGRSPRTVHRDGILDVSIAPARVSRRRSPTQARGDRDARSPTALDYLGVLCVEMFVDRRRPRCSSTRSRRARTTAATTRSTPASPRSSSSRRACWPACRWATRAQHDAGGDGQPARRPLVRRTGARTPREPDWARVLRHPQAKLHLYGKTEPRRGRKMGHVTCLGRDAGRRARDRPRDQARCSRFPAPISCDAEAAPAARRYSRPRPDAPAARSRLHALSRRPRGRRRQDRGHGRWATTRAASALGREAFRRSTAPSIATSAASRSISRTRAAARCFSRSQRMPTSSSKAFGPASSLGSALTTKPSRRSIARIVYASISGYGQQGPRAQAAGHDINYLGYAGVLDQCGARDGPPALCNLQIADLLGGAAAAAIAILAALVGAQRTGRGRYVDVAMADAALAHNIFALHALNEWGRDAAARRRSADGRRSVLWRLCHAGWPLARRRRARGQVLEGAVRDDRASRPCPAAGSLAVTKAPG